MDKQATKVFCECTALGLLPSPVLHGRRLCDCPPACHSVHRGGQPLDDGGIWECLACNFVTPWVGIRAHGNAHPVCLPVGGGLSWETTSERLRAYFENFGVVREAFVSYNRNNGRPRGFGFVVFESIEVADKVVSTKHTIDRREVRGLMGVLAAALAL